MVEWLIFIGLITFGLLHHISKQIEAADKRTVAILERIIKRLEKYD